MEYLALPHFEIQFVKPLTYARPTNTFAGFRHVDRAVRFALKQVVVHSEEVVIFHIE